MTVDDIEIIKCEVVYSRLVHPPRPETTVTYKEVTTGKRMSARLNDYFTSQSAKNFLTNIRNQCAKHSI